MAVLSSSATDAQIKAEWDDAASYLEDDSPSKAKRFITAGRMLLRRLAQSAHIGPVSIGLNVAAIKEAIDEAAQWLSVRDAAGDGVTYFDVSEYRA